MRYPFNSAALRRFVKLDAHLAAECVYLLQVLGEALDRQVGG
jgi:hypothetical protein